MKILLSSAATALLAAALSPAQVRLNHLTTVDLDPTSVAANPEYIGSNPSAIAWNGTDLLVAGYNNDSPNNPPATIGIVRVSNALTMPTFGAAFGQVSTPGFRGYSGLDTDGSNLVAAYDDGTTNAQGIALHDASDNIVWSKTARGGSGVGFDPGVPGGTAQGRGVAWTTFGSGRRALQDGATGADIWTTSTGMIIDAGVGFFWRDMDFDDQTGDIWLREGNNVVRGVRNGDNSLSARLLVVDGVEADFVNVQNLAVVRQATGGVVFYNDRASNQAPQAFEDVIRAVRFDGTPEAIAYVGFAIPPSTNINGAFDFSYDAATGTTPELTLGGSGAAGTTLTYTIDGAPANATGFIVFGAIQGQLPLGNGCDVLVSPLLDVFLGPLFLSGTGSGRTSLALPAGTTGAQITQQGAIIDLGLPGPLQIVTTEGVQLVIQ